MYCQMFYVILKYKYRYFMLFFPPPNLIESDPFITADVFSQINKSKKSTSTMAEIMTNC